MTHQRGISADSADIAVDGFSSKESREQEMTDVTGGLSNCRPATVGCLLALYLHTANRMRIIDDQL